MSKKLIALIVVATGIIAAVLLFRYSGGASTALWSVSNGGQWLLPLIVVASLLDSINPCAFSILILTIAFLMSIGKVRTSVLKIGFTYIAGIFVVYMLIGLGIMQTLHLFDTPHFMAKLGAALLILFGAINLINEFFPSFPIKLKIPGAAHHKMAQLMEKASLPAVFALGLFVGLCEFPCTGGPYLMVLGLLHDTATYTAGFGYLVLYNLIFVLPLAIILLIASDSSLLDKVKTWQRKETHLMRYGGGLAMIILGILILIL